MTLTDQDRDQIQADLDEMRDQRTTLRWAECVSDDARVRRDQTVGRMDLEIVRVERLLEEESESASDREAAQAHERNG